MGTAGSSSQLDDGAGHGAVRVGLEEDIDRAGQAVLLAELFGTALGVLANGLVDLLRVSGLPGWRKLPISAK